VTDLIERLRGYNPPDRTVDSQRQISVDIHEAADELARLTKIEAAARNVFVHQSLADAEDALKKLEEVLKND
jgi:hypothetical protein